ncbi:enoyl-CoA hydratase-related protein [Pseudomonas sp. NY15436]|uniref:enoyl-CoA hydratase-related protein n=1 Tax=Pseudomonas sp. NY15436 TaxID=3400359 RepID=UPI003A8C1B65
MIDCILSELSEGVLTLRLNRPEKYNALTNAMYTTLANTLSTANQDPAVKVVIITGGSTCFTSGNDLRDFLEAPPTHLDAPAFRFMKSVIELEKPLIAEVCGAAIGIGTTLLPHCDLVFITRNSKLSMPFVKLGLCQEFAASLTMPAILGPTRATQLLLCGDTFNGQQAADWGLANAAFESAEECLEAVRSHANKLAAAPQDALRTSRRLLRSASLCTLRATIQAENEAFITCVQSDLTRDTLQTLVNSSSKR